MNATRTMTALVSAIAIALTGMSTAQATPIDLFEDGSFSLSAFDLGTVDISTETGLDASTVIGGQRQVTLTNMGPGVGTVTTTLDQANDLAVTESDEFAGFEWMAMYGADEPLGADLSSWTHISAVFPTLPDSGLLSLDLASGSTSGTSGVFAPDVSGNEVSFAFDAAGFEDIDLTSVDTIALRITTDAGDSFELDTIRAVPEPGMLALLGFGAFTLFGRRNR